jgi:AbrB family looped-hinge helix DNA binding protein
MRITQKGQVTIPLEIRQKLGLLPHTEVEFEIDGNAARIRKARGAKNHGRGAEVIARLRGSGGVSMSTDEIMALTRGEK